jgi:hypothetical protein
MHPVDEIFAAFGNSPTKLATATGLKVQTVFDWKAKGPKNIPTWRRQAVLDALRSAGKSISAETLRYLAQAEAA